MGFVITSDLKKGVYGNSLDHPRFLLAEKNNPRQPTRHLMTRRPLARQRYITPTRKSLALFIFLTGIMVSMVTPAHAATGEELASADLPKTTINSASIIQSGRFTLPRLGHCQGGPGYNSLDPLSALETWVEDGIPPQHILSSRIKNGITVRTRSVCPYPAVAKWNGTGNPNNADSLTCAAK